LWIKTLGGREESAMNDKCGKVVNFGDMVEDGDEIEIFSAPSGG